MDKPGALIVFICLCYNKSETGQCGVGWVDRAFLSHVVLADKTGGAGASGHWCGLQVGGSWSV